MLREAKKRGEPNGSIGGIRPGGSARLLLWQDDCKRRLVRINYHILKERGPRHESTRRCDREEKEKSPGVSPESKKLEKGNEMEFPTLIKASRKQT